MGILFIPAGTALGRNRERTLEHAHNAQDLRDYLRPWAVDNLDRFFPDGQLIYLWGATQPNRRTVQQVQPNEFVVDVNGDAVVQVFRFCFSTEVQTEELQRFVGWDSDADQPRFFDLIFFLKSPVRTRRRSKQFFQDAFGEGSNHWLDRQRYFDSSKVDQAIAKCGDASVEAFLGIAP